MSNITMRSDLEAARAALNIELAAARNDYINIGKKQRRASACVAILADIYTVGDEEIGAELEKAEAKEHAVWKHMARMEERVTSLEEAIDNIDNALNIIVTLGL